MFVNIRAKLTYIVSCGGLIKFYKVYSHLQVKLLKNIQSMNYMKYMNMPKIYSIILLISKLNQTANITKIM